MKNPPTMEVSLKSPENSDQVFLSPIESLPYIKERDLLINIEFYFCTALSVFLWSYFTTSLGFHSYNSILKEKITSAFSYLSKFRDFQDAQWKFFRTNSLYILFFASIFLLISKIIKKNSIEYTKIFYLVSGFFFTIYLVQIKIIYLLFAGLCFYFTKNFVSFGAKGFVSICWIELFLVRYVIYFIQSNISIGNNLRIQKLSKIDDLSWNFILVYSLLKMLSYNIEYKKIFFKENESQPEGIFNLNQAKSHCMSCYDGNFCMKCLENTILDDKDKIDNSFNIINFLIYIFYPPLVGGGPLINYNAFLFQLKISKESEHNKLLKMNKLLYLLEIILIAALMEVYNHFIYPIFLFKQNIFSLEDNSQFSLFYYCFLLINVLTFLWLKFAIIWKTFRLWAWCDGIIVEENMNRFVYDIYSIELLFRGLNRSLNRWIVRYIYIPLGGKNKKYVNIFAAFAFWYLIFDYSDIEYGIFCLICCILMDLEMFLINTFINKFGEDYNDKIIIRYCKYLLCSVYLLIIFCISLFGFHFSLNNMKIFADNIIEKGGYLYILTFVLFFFPNVVMTFFIRDMELENAVSFQQKPKNY